MKTNFKRLLSLLLVMLMVGSMMPSIHAQASTPQESETVALTDEDYAVVNDVFAQIDAMEEAPAKKSANQTQLTDAAAEIVMASENYVEGSLERNGNTFTWWTDEGIRCIYDPRMREKYDNMEAPAEPEEAGIYNAPKATKGGWPSGNQVYLIAPYYGIDDSFTDQYKNEATAIASAIGDTDGYTLCSGQAVTVDTVADAIENGAVVIFDSHGTTDYTNPNDDYEFVTGANYSYLCLTSKSGLTTEDYNDGATYFTDTDGYMCACINGATIANHMDKQSPGGLLWMAICLGMATDTMCAPMREMGVEVVYGYSQSVTFAGDYCFEETFWDNMTAGKDVATSVAAMKSRWGNWDWSTQIATSYGYTDGYSTISAARADYAAFPIVVSDEDAHPGQKTGSSNYGADSLQTVKSTYTLYSQYAVTAQSSNTAYGTVSASGNTITASPANGYFAQSATVISGTATVSQNGNIFTVMAESDCVVQINFAAKTAVTVSFAGATVAAQTGYAGDSMSLPTADAPEGYKFLGWMTAPLSEDTTEKPSYYTDSFIPTASTTLYALYSYVDETAGGGSGDYVKVTETPADWSGEYLIVYEAGSRVFDGSAATLEKVSNYQNVTISDNTISAEEADAYRFIIAAMDGGYSIQSASGMYISGTSGSNKLTAGTSPSANTISITASGEADIVSNTSHLRYNATSGQDRFRYYKSTSYSSQKAIALFVKDGSAGTTYYTTTLCDHENTVNVAAVAATCTADGCSAGVKCADCNAIISGCEVIPATGHSFGEWVETTAPGCETAGEQTHTCASCGETETQAVAALGHTVGEGTVTTAATCTTAGVMSYSCSACGNTTTEEIPATGHSYDNGVVTTAATCTADGVKTYTCSACGSTKTEAIPATGHNYVNGACSACGEAEPEIDGTRYYIAAIRSSGNYYYMTSDLGTANTKRYQAVDSGLTTLPETITDPQDGYVFILIDNGDGTYSLQAEGVDGDNYLGWTSGNSGTLVAEANALKLTVDIADGVYNIHFAASDAERYLAMNNNTGNNYFAWYKSGQAQDLSLIPVGGSTAEPEEPTEPEITEPEVTEPEVTEPEVTEPVNGSNATISFATTEQRVSFDTSAQVWANGGATLTNNKGSSTSNVADYSNPARFYKNSDIIITFPGMTKIEITCSTDAYATALVNSISDSGVTVSADGQIVTIEFAEATDEFSFTLTSGQVRMKELTVYGSEETHTHSYHAVVTAPTCTEEGYTTYTCDCGDSYAADKVAALGHSYESVVTPPTTEAQGYTTHTCTVCGDNYVDSYVDPIVLPSGNAALKISGATLTLQADLKVAFAVKPEVLEAYSNVYFKFKFDGKEVIISDSYYNTANGRQMYTLPGVAPRMMNDVIEIEMYGTYEGVEYAYTNTYTVMTYCNSQLGKVTEATKLTTLIVDLMNFGTMQQIYNNYKTDALINAGLTEEQKAWGRNVNGDQTFTSVFGQSGVTGTASFTGASLTLSDAVVVNYVVKTDDLIGITLKITVDGEETIIGSEAFVLVEGYTNRYEVKFTGLRARQMRSTITAVVLRDGVETSKTATYSVESYAAGVASGTNLYNLCQAMMHYGDAAIAYFNS